METNLPAKSKALLWIGSIGPLGHLPASGTVSVAVCGIPLYWLMHQWPPTVFVPVVLVFTAASVWLHDVGDRLLGVKDSGTLVWDELVGFMFAVAFLNVFTWQLALLGFLMERAIDIVKVPPANWIEDKWKGGLGVVGDDVMAGIYTCGLLHLAIHFFPEWVGVAT